MSESLAEPGQQIDQFQIEELLGQGGMALVYKALDTRLNRVVALKILSSGKSKLKESVQRFNAETRVLARLHHPNIIKVLSYGMFEGAPYLVMEYLPGRTLKSRMGNPIPWQTSAQWLAPVARALEFAHQHGIVHRDVKPTNILFDKEERPVLSDFGIAWLAESEETQDLAETGTIGTPQYMSPEQGLGQAADARADIFSLGALFYELITGQSPFKGATPLEILYNQTHKPLIRPATYVKELPGDVERIIYKALSIDPAKRYTQMGDFAQELERLAKGVVRPGRFRIPASSNRMTNRTRVIYGLSGILILAGALTLGKFLFMQHGSSSPTLPQVSVSSIISIIHMATDTPGLISANMTKTPLPTFQPTFTTIETVDPVIGTGNMALLIKVASLPSGTAPISSLAFSSDGNAFASGSHDKTIQVWQTSDLILSQKITAPDAVDNLALSSDGKLVVEMSRTKGIWLWNVADGSLVWTFQGPANCLAVSGKGDFFAVGFSDWRVIPWQFSKCDPKGSDCVRQAGVFAQSDSVTDVSFSSDGETILSMSNKGFRWWQLSTGKLLSKPANSPSGALFFSPDGQTLANITYTNPVNEPGKLNQGSLNLLRPLNFSIFHTLYADNTVIAAEFNPSSKLIAAATGSNVNIWDVDKGDLLKTIDCTAEGQCVSLAFSPNGQFLLVGTDKGIVQSWQIKP